MTKPLISIVLCCHNRAHLLPQTMASIFAQTYQPIEIVVLDDGSTDNTAELMIGYGDKIRYFFQENQGVAVARNNACRNTKGKLIAFIDDDDLMPPERINILYEALCQYPSAIMAVGDIAIIDENGQFTGHRWLPEDDKNDHIRLIDDGYEAVLWTKVPASLHSTLFRKTDGERIGWFDTQYKFTSEDKDFLARLGRLGPIVYIPKIVSYYRVGHTSLTHNRFRAACSALGFLENHLQSLESHRQKLRIRLQNRILTVLKKIALYKSLGLIWPDEFNTDIVKKALPLLTLRQRLNLKWYTMAKLPIRRIIHHNDYP